MYRPPSPNPPALPGGYKIGDQVISRVEQQDSGNNSGDLSIGDEGTVLAPKSNSSASDADRRLLCRFPKKSSSIYMLVKQIRRPEETMVLKTVRSVQRLLLAAMTLRTMQDSSNDQSAVQVRL